MCGLSADIRDADRTWLRQRSSASFRAQWLAEGRERHLDAHEVHAVLAALETYAALRDEGTGIEASCFARIWQSDGLVPLVTSQALEEGVRREFATNYGGFRNPKWSQQVLDLIHPSLYCWVAGRTLDYSTPFQETMPGTVDATSRSFAWLATDYSVTLDASGRPQAERHSYINNLHPDNVNLRAAIDHVVGAFIPLFERVLDDASTQRSLPTLIYELNDPLHSASQRHGIRLAGRDIQLFVKLSRIYLTPENPTFPGGDYHYEGLRNERIVACGVYCIDECNVEELELSFRMKVDPPTDMTYDDARRASEVWGIALDGMLNQELPSTRLPAGRCIAFPNMYQHRSAAFSLRDRARRGHRTILSLLLVDPTARVVSTSDVPAQQAEWLLGSRPDVMREPDSGIPLPKYVFWARDAQLYREQLEDERDAFSMLTQNAWAEERWTMGEMDLDTDTDSMDLE